MTLSLARALSSRQNSTASTPRASASPPATQRQIICPPFKPSPPDQQCPQHPELPSGRPDPPVLHLRQRRSEEHTSELQSLMRISYAVFCLNKKKKSKETTNPLIAPLKEQ